MLLVTFAFYAKKLRWPKNDTNNNASSKTFMHGQKKYATTLETFMQERLKTFMQFRKY